MKPILMLVGALCVVFQLTGCGSQNYGPDDWYRVDPLFNNKSSPLIADDGSLNPYRFRFGGQPSSDEKAASNAQAELAIANDAAPQNANPHVRIKESANKPLLDQREEIAAKLDAHTKAKPPAQVDGKPNPQALEWTATLAALRTQQKEVNKQIAAQERHSGVSNDTSVSTVASRRKAREAVLGIGGAPVIKAPETHDSGATIPVPTTPVSQPSAQDKADISELELRTTTSAYESARASQINRDRFISLLVAQSDALVGRHIAAIIGTQNAAELGLGTTALVTSSLATALSPPGTKTALSAASAIATGTRAAVREQIYSNAFGWAIGQAIVDKRSEIYRTRIQANLGRSIEEYSIDQALADVQQYHESGSFYLGLMEINKKIAAGDRSGLFTKGPPLASITLPDKTVKSPTTDDRSVKVKVEFTKQDSRAYKLRFENVKSVKLSEANSSLARTLADDKSGMTFELLLPGHIEFTVVPAYKQNNGKEPADKEQGFAAIIMSFDDSTVHVVEVTIDKPATKPADKPGDKPDGKPAKKPDDKPAP